MKDNVEIIYESAEGVYLEIERMLNKARYEELYQYGILTYDRTKRVVSERLAELKKQIEG